MTTRGPLAPLTPHSEADNDDRLDNGWATWTGDADVLRRLRHSHFLPHGCEFAHAHRGGSAPHDHPPGDPRWARMEKEDLAESEAGQ